MKSIVDYHPQTHCQQPEIFHKRKSYPLEDKEDC